MSKLNKRIEKEVPNDGEFWRESAKEIFIGAGADLKKRGFTDDEIISLLSTLYQAAAEEFGA